MITRNLLLILIALSSATTFARAEVPCSHNQFRNWASMLFDGGDRAHDYLIQKLQNGRIKNFDFDVYLKSKETLHAFQDLPRIPSREQFEAHLAWLEVAEARALAKSSDTQFLEGLPTLEHTLFEGTPRQKLALTNWSKKYGAMFEKKFTERQLKKATADLSIILHDSRLDLAELTRSGLQNSTEQFLKAEYHAKILEKGLIEAFGADKLFRKELLKDKVKNLLGINAVKWPLYSGMNVTFAMGSKYVANAFIIKFPAHQIARVSVDDMALLISEGFEKHGAAMAAKYAPQVKTQIAYNTLKRSTQTLSYLSWCVLARNLINDHLNYKQQLKEKRLTL